VEGALLEIGYHNRRVNSLLLPNEYERREDVLTFHLRREEFKIRELQTRNVIKRNIPLIGGSQAGGGTADSRAVARLKRSWEREQEVIGRESRTLFYASQSQL
jgi:hypothetical protein